MRKNVVLAACVALPFVTAAAANLMIPDYAFVTRTSTYMITLIIAITALFSFSLNMEDNPDSPAGWMLATGWTLAVALTIIAITETVIPRPGALNASRWMTIVGLAAICLVSGCDRQGIRAGRDQLLRALALTSMAVGGTLLVSMAISAAAKGLSGKDEATLLIALLLSLPIGGAMVQTQRARNKARAWLSAGCATLALLILATTSGTYAYAPEPIPVYAWAT